MPRYLKLQIQLKVKSNIKNFIELNRSTTSNRESRLLLTGLNMANNLKNSKTL